MTDATRAVGVYRTSGGDEQVIASSGRILVGSGGTINMASGATLTLNGQAVTTTGAINGNSVTSTGAGNFNSVTSTGTITGQTIVSTGAVASFVAGVKSTAGGFTSTGSGVAATFDAVTSTGTGTFNAVSSTGTGTFNAIAVSTGGSYIAGMAGFKKFVEVLTSANSNIVGYGVSHITITTGPLTFQLAAPVANVEKWITCVSSTNLVISTTGAGAGFVGGSSNATITSGTVGQPQWMHLIGNDSTSWRILGCSTGALVLS